MEYIPYTQEELDFLSQRDPLLGAAILRMGEIRRESHPAPFISLVRSIVGQVVSRKAADTIYDRLESLCGGEVSPVTLCALQEEQLKACGMSLRKAQNILTIAQRTRVGEIDFEAMEHMQDGEIIKLLTALPGVGVWTVEMLLLFSMGRRDILSYSDLGIRNGIRCLHNLEKLSNVEFEEYRKLYSPCGTAASLYLWELWAECQRIQKRKA